MADYFTHFSCLLDVGTPENAARAFDLRAALAEDPEQAVADGSAMSIEEHGGARLWLHDDAAGDPGQVIHFVRRCAAEFGLTGLWGFRYAKTCSRQRLDGFCGARVLALATGQTIAWTDTDGWRATVLGGGDPDA
jgi:hypothetical protein